MARILGIVNLKGGVGKTTTSVNLGAALALYGFRVLLVDLDPQKSLSGWAGIDKWPTVSNILTGEVDPYQAIAKWGKTKCWVIPAGRDLRMVENQLLSVSQREYILKQKLQRFFDFDFIVIDSAPSAGLLTINAVCASHEIIIPLQTEILALESTIPFFETLGEIKKRFHPDLKIAGILANMYDARTNLSKAILDQMRASEHLGPLMFKTVIRKNVKLAETPSLGYPITRYSASYGAEDYQALAEELLNDADRAKIEAIKQAKALKNSSLGLASAEADYHINEDNDGDESSDDSGNDIVIEDNEDSIDETIEGDEELSISSGETKSLNQE